MPIAFDAVSGSAQASGLTSGTCTHTCTGNNRILFSSVLADSGDQITGVTYNGVAMTQVAKKLVDPLDANAFAYLYVLTNPASGANNIVASASAAQTLFNVRGVSYTGANQFRQVDASVTGTVNSTSISGTVTTKANNCWIMGYYRFGNGYTTAGANTTLRTPGIGNSGFQTFVDSNGVISPAGNGTLTLNGTSSACLEFTVSFAPTGAGTNLIQSTGTAVLGLGSISTTWGANTTTGNLIVVGVNLTNAAALGTVSSITDNQANTYTQAAKGTINSLGDILNAELWYAKNITGGAGSVTVNHTIDNCAMFVREYSGFDTLDVAGSASGSSTTPNSGTVTTTQAPELLIVATGDDIGASQTWTAAGAYGNIVGTATTITGVSMEDNYVISTGAQTGTLTLGAAANWDSLFASFYKANAGKATFKTLLGVGNT